MPEASIFQCHFPMNIFELAFIYKTHTQKCISLLPTGILVILWIEKRLCLESDEKAIYPKPVTVFDLKSYCFTCMMASVLSSYRFCCNCGISKCTSWQAIPESSQTKYSSSLYKINLQHSQGARVRSRLSWLWMGRSITYSGRSLFMWPSFCLISLPHSWILIKGLTEKKYLGLKTGTGKTWWG